MKTNENARDASPAVGPSDSRQQMLAKVGAALVAATAASAAPATAAPVLRRLTQPRSLPPPSVIVERGVKLVLRDTGDNYNIFFGLTTVQGSGSQQMGLGSVAVVNYLDTKSTEVLMQQLQATPATCTVDNGVAQVSLGIDDASGGGWPKCLPNPNDLFNKLGIYVAMDPLTPPISNQGATIVGNKKK